MKKILLLIVVLSNMSMRGQQSPQTIAEDFFIKYEKSTSEAINYIFSTNHYFSKQQTTDFIKKVNDGLRALGDYCGNELIQKENIGSSFILFNYLVKYERQPVKFSFIFYKPKDTWLLYNFNFNAELDIELQSAAKINLLIK